MRTAAMSATLLAVAVLSSCGGEKGKGTGSADASSGATPSSAFPVLSAPGTPLDSARARARALEARAGAFRADSGTWSAGDASSEYAVLLENNQPAILEEKLSLGERGASLNRFWFEGGRVFLYEERGVRTATKDVGYSLTVETRLDVAIAFDSTGAVTGSSYGEDGRELPLPKAKVQEAKSRARALVEHLRRKR